MTTARDERRKQLFSAMNYKAVHVTKVTDYDGYRRVATLSGFGLPGEIVMKFDADFSGVKALNLTAKPLKEGDTVVVALHEEIAKGADGRRVAALGVVGVIGWPYE